MSSCQGYSVTYDVIKHISIIWQNKQPHYLEREREVLHFHLKQKMRQKSIMDSTDILFLSSFQTDILHPVPSHFNTIKFRVGLGHKFRPGVIHPPRPPNPHITCSHTCTQTHTYGLITKAHYSRLTVTQQFY